MNRLKDNRFMGAGDYRKLQRPTVTAQPAKSKGFRSPPDISIQSLASHPELLPKRWCPQPTKSIRPSHDRDCECDKCEASEEDISELNFDMD